MWINPKTLDVYRTHSEIRLAFPQVSLPVAITDDTVSGLGLHPIVQVAKPDGKVVEARQPRLVDGQWVQQWEVREPVEYEVRAQCIEIRHKRNRLLTESDWIAVSSYERGQAVPQAWVDYRQALRDVTAQPGFPWDVEWPRLPD